MNYEEEGGAEVPALFQIASLDTYDFAVAHDDQLAVLLFRFLDKAFTGQQNTGIDLLLHLLDFDFTYNSQSFRRITYLRYDLLCLFRPTQ